MQLWEVTHGVKCYSKFYFCHQIRKQIPFLAVADLSPLYSWVCIESSRLFHESVGRMTTKVKINKHLIYIDCYLWISERSSASPVFACKTEFWRSDQKWCIRLRDFVTHMKCVVKSTCEANIWLNICFPNVGSSAVFMAARLINKQAMLNAIKYIS